MSCKETDTYLDDLFDGVNPKARYIAQMHVQEYIDSIYMEIVNGDNEVSAQKKAFQEKSMQKNSFEQNLRHKMISDANKQKQYLQHKLQYLRHSINILQKSEQDHRYSKNANQRSETKSQNRKREEWKKEIEERSENIQKRKKQSQQRREKKEKQLKEVQVRLKQEETERKKKEIAEKVEALGEQSKKRYEFVKESNEKIKKLKREKHLFQKLGESFNQKQMSLLEERKKKLAEIRSFHQPIDEAELRDHENKFLETKKQKEQLRDREKRMNSARSSSYQPSYKSSFYQKALEESRAGIENGEQTKKQRMKQFSDEVKEKYVPEIDQKKRQQIQSKLVKQIQAQQQKIQKQRELFEKGKQKGNQYLQQFKKLPKKQRKSSLQNSPKSQKIVYDNYIVHHDQSQVKKKVWNKILQSEDDKQGKALNLRIQSQRKQTELKRKQKQMKLLKHRKSTDIDQQYFNMIKAKLDLLEK